MKVSELIEKLQAFDPDAPVFYRDREYGDTEVEDVDMSEWGRLDFSDDAGPLVWVSGVGVRIN